MFFVVTGIYRRVSFEKTINKINTLDDQKKQIFHETTISAIKIYRFLLYMTPICLFAIPYVIYVYTPKNFANLLIVMIIMYIVIIEEYMFRKKFLKRLKAEQFKHHSA
jgi:hypothetical protein